MRGLPFPVPLFREGRGKPRPYGVTGNSPYLIGPDTPSGRAHKDGGRTMCAPTNWPKASRRGGFQPPEKPSPLQGEGVTAHAATDEGSSFPRPAFSRRAGQAMGRKGSAPPQKTGAWGSVLLQIPPRPGSVLWEQLRLLGAQLLQDLLGRLGGQIQPLIEVGAAAAGTQDGLLPPPLVHLGVVA